MKRIFSVLSVLGILAQAGCAGSWAPNFNLLQGADVSVLNNCWNSDIYVKTPYSEETRVHYGNPAVTIPVNRGMGNADGNMVLTARGVGFNGENLGTTHTTVGSSQNGRTQVSWPINYLEGGERSCQRPSRGFLEQVLDWIAGAL